MLRGAWGALCAVVKPTTSARDTRHVTTVANKARVAPDFSSRLLPPPLARSAASSYTIYNTHTPPAHAQVRASGPPASLAAPGGAAALHSQVNRVESSIQEGLIASIYSPCLLLMPCTNTTPLPPPSHSKTHRQESRPAWTFITAAAVAAVRRLLAVCSLQPLP